MYVTDVKSLIFHFMFVLLRLIACFADWHFGDPYKIGLHTQFQHKGLGQQSCQPGGSMQPLHIVLIHDCSIQ